MNYEFSQNVVNFGHAIRMLLMFGTPMFIFISEFVIAHAYKNGVPNDFLIKRIKYILIPYICMGILYTLAGLVNAQEFSMHSFLVGATYKLVLGDFHGYFILVIFQFYVLHVLFSKYLLNRFKMKQVIFITVLINTLHLILFDYIAPKITPFLSQYVFETLLYKLSYLPFTAWIGYFSIAYYCGTNYEKFKRVVMTSKPYIFIPVLILSVGIMEFLTLTGTNENISSKRTDVLLFTFCMIWSLFWFATKIKKVPKLIILISQYSFGIYLLHPFVHTLTLSFLRNIGFTLHPIIFLVLICTIGLVGSILLTYVVNKLKLGKFIVGKIGRNLYHTDSGKLYKKAS